MEGRRFVYAAIAASLTGIQPGVRIAALGEFTSVDVDPRTDSVRIYSIKGSEMSPIHDRETAVVAEEVVDLYADVYRKIGHGTDESDYEPLFAIVEDFIWSAEWVENVYDGSRRYSVRRSAVCDAAASQENEPCLAHSPFQVNDYGVSVHVPPRLSRGMKVKVQHRNKGLREDFLVLRNSNFQDWGDDAYDDIVSGPDEYHYDSLDEVRALRGWGSWITVSGMRYWVPTRYHADWVPYTRGYWSWSARYGLVWVSYDPWGWWTDHYGVWRYHGNYGWIWLPFPTRSYRPHCVTFVWSTGDLFGWYPSYYWGWRDGYRHGYNDGFWDGYWAGYHDGRRDESDDRYDRYKGLSVVKYKSVLSGRDMKAIRLADRDSEKFFRTSLKNRTVGGRVADRDGDGVRDWLERRGSGRLPKVEVRQRKVGRGDETLVYTDRPTDVPNDVRNHVKGRRADRERKRPVPVASVVEYGANGRRVVQPRTENRGTSVPPKVRNRENGSVRTLPPRTKRPSRENPENNRHPGDVHRDPGADRTPPVVRPEPRTPPKQPERPRRPEPPVVRPSPESPPKRPEQPDHRPERPREERKPPVVRPEPRTPPKQPERPRPPQREEKRQPAPQPAPRPKPEVEKRKPTPPSPQPPRKKDESRPKRPPNRK